jgi:hypothetical protein
MGPEHNNVYSHSDLALTAARGGAPREVGLGSGSGTRLVFCLSKFNGRRSFEAHPF